MAKTFEEWAATEVHDPNKKISNLEKLTADFLIGDYKTWGDVYEAAGIEPPKAKPKAKKADKASDLDRSITMVEDLLSKKEREVLRFEPGSEEYIKITDAIKKDKEALKKLKTRRDVAKASESDTKKKETFESEKNTYESKLELAKKKLQIAKDTDGDVAAAQAELDRVTATKPFTPVVGTENVAMAGQPSGYRNVGTQTTGVAPTPTPAAGTPPKAGTPSQSGEKPKGTKPPKDGKTPPPTTKPKTIDEIIDLVANKYGSIDTIFKTDPGLQALLRKAIGKDGVPNTDDDLTVDQFVNELENTDWFKTNANAVRQRGFYKRQFDDLVARGSDPEELYKTTEYGRGLRNTQQVIADEIVRVGGNLSPEDIEVLSRDIYDLGYESQKAIVSQRIRAKISYKPGGIVSGEAGENLAELKKTAKANGLDLEKNFGDSVQGWLQKLAQGESVETFKQIIRGSAKIGLPEKVSALLDQGVDLDTVYNPYKRLMASVLEINPETITLDDSVLRSAIGPDKEMSLYDYQKMLRKDNRWQYTNQAKEEVSNVAMKVLRDFGFQG